MLSKLPDNALSGGLPLRRDHRDMYQSLRANQSCVANQRRMLFIGGPSGRHYCSVRMKSAVLPNTEGPRVKSEEAGPTNTAASSGMWNVPDGVSGA